MGSLWLKKGSLVIFFLSFLVPNEERSTIKARLVVSLVSLTIMSTQSFKKF